MNFHRRLSILFTTIVISGCLFGQSSLRDISLPDIKGTTVSLASFGTYQGTVYFFLSPDCPLCENYAKTINDLRLSFPEKDIKFTGIFPGKYYSKMEILAYMDKYHPPLQVLLDPDLALTCYLDASITPEVFVVDHRGKVVYQGKIDNWVAALGKHRTVVNQHYLKDALTALMNGKPLAISRTEAIGCLIE
ncbi:MAG: redoxin domain-containing protein [Bacteroidia bacterium]